MVKKIILIIPQSLYESIDLDDLHDLDSSSGVVLEMKDRDRYYDGRTGDQSSLEDVCLTKDSFSPPIKSLLETCLPIGVTGGPRAVERLVESFGFGKDILNPQLAKMLDFHSLVKYWKKGGRRCFADHDAKCPSPSRGQT